MQVRQPAEPLLLGIDVGTSSVKAVLVDAQGNIHSTGQAEYPLHHIKPGWVEQDPEDWWHGTCKAVKEALAKVSDGAEKIQGLAISCQAPSLLSLDRTGQPLRPAMIWMDRRAEAETLKLAELMRADRIHQITGNRPDAFYLAPRLLWLQNNEPEVMKRTWKFVQANGYINYRLTGQVTLDPSNAALLQLRNYQKEEWSEAMCDASGVKSSQFPEVMAAHMIQGKVTVQASEATGLKTGTPVMAGTVDSSSAAIEAGVVEPGIVAEMTGTSTVVIMPNDTGLTEPSFIAMPHALPGLHLLLAAMVSSGGCLRWFRDQFGQQEVKAASEGKVDAYDLLTNQASEVSLGSDGIIFLPYMMGERSPIWHTNARGVFVGLSLATRKAALIRSILEGTAFALRHNIEVAKQAGAEVREVRSVGGCSTNNLWNQIKADVLGLPIVVPRMSVGSPFGAAIIAGIGVGMFPDIRQSLTEMVHLDRRFEPVQANHERYMRNYQVFRDIYEHLKGDFDHLAKVTP